MAKRTDARPPAAARPPRARASSVPAFGGWEVAGGAAAAAPDYSLDFTKIRADRMQRRRKALSWSSFVIGNAAVAVAEAPGSGGAGEEEEKRQWSSDADDDDNDRERRRHHQHGQRHRLRRLRSADEADDRQPIQPGRAAPKGRSKVKGYLFGCVGGQW